MPPHPFTLSITQGTLQPEAQADGTLVPTFRGTATIQTDDAPPSAPLACIGQALVATTLAAALRAQRPVRVTNSQWDATQQQLQILYTQEVPPDSVPPSPASTPPPTIPTTQSAPEEPVPSDADAPPMLDETPPGSESTDAPSPPTLAQKQHLWQSAQAARLTTVPALITWINQQRPRQPIQDMNQLSGPEMTAYAQQLQQRIATR
jgi:hypothetical protein